MKKFTLTLLALLGGVSAFAAFQYTQVGTGENSYPLGTFHFTSDQYWRITVSGQPGFGSVAGITDMGYYNVNNKVLVSAGGNKDLLGNFKSGDEIGLWLRDGNGNLFTSSDIGIGTASGAVFDGGRGIQIFYTNEFGNANDAYNFQITSMAGASSDLASPAPSGQPLPGVIATLLLGGGAAAAAAVRKRRKSVK